MRLNQARAADIFTIAVIASVVIALFAFAWRLMDMLSHTPPATLRHAPSQVGDIGPVLALAPFGKADANSAPQTSLALELRGVVLAQPKSASTALIAPTGGAPVAYAIGRAVPGGATIEDIASDRVLLRTNGRLERLDLPHVSTASAAPSPVGIGQTPPPPPSSPMNTPPPGLLGNASGPPAAISLLDMVPAVAGPGGYRVGTPLSPNAQRAGLQPGDVIERVNGLTPDALAGDRGAVAAIMASGSAEVTTLRAGRRLSLSFPLR